jgi:ABC-2 type transport system permease protein
MRNIWVICHKELKSYFASPVAYGLLVFFSLIVGYVTATAVTNVVINGPQAQQMGPIDVNEWVVRPIFGNINVFSLFLIPMIAMRIFSEEKRSGTFELLATSPITDWEIIIGKWLGAWLLYLCVLAVAALNIALLFAFSTPDGKPALTGLIGLALQGGGMLAIGGFISSLTKNQVVAGAATFGLCLLLWLTNWVTEFNQAPWAKVVGYASVMAHMDSFSKGVLDSRDIVYYLSLIFFGLFLTARSIESLRWRS